MRRWRGSRVCATEFPRELTERTVATMRPEPPPTPGWRTKRTVVTRLLKYSWAWNLLLLLSLYLSIYSQCPRAQSLTGAIRWPAYSVVSALVCLPVGSSWINRSADNIIWHLGCLWFIWLMHVGDCVSTDCGILCWQKHQSSWIYARIKLAKVIYTPVNAAEESQDLRNGYLDNGVPSWSCFDGPSATLGFVVSSMVGFGLHLYLQLILAKLARQRPVQGRQWGGPGGRKNNQNNTNKLPSERHFIDHAMMTEFVRMPLFYFLCIFSFDCDC